MSYDPIDPHALSEGASTFLLNEYVALEREDRPARPEPTCDTCGRRFAGIAQLVDHLIGCT